MSLDGMLPNLTASGNTNAYRMVKVTGVRTGAQAAGASDLVVGVTDGSLNLFDGTYNAPTGAPINLFPSWTVQILSGAAITAGDALTSDSTGRAITATVDGSKTWYVALETAGAANVLVWAYRCPSVLTAGFLTGIAVDEYFTGNGTAGSPLTLDHVEVDSSTIFGAGTVADPLTTDAP
jgi:hypothetical protein